MKNVNVAQEAAWRPLADIKGGVTMFHAVTRGILAAAVVGLCSSGVWAQDLPHVNLKVSGGNRTQNMFRYIQEPFFSRELPESTGGAITTDFAPLDELGLQGPEVLRLLQLGMFDISEGTLSYMAGEDPHFDGLDLPGVTSDIEVQRKLTDAYRSTLSEILEDKFRVKLLSMSPVSLQVIYCKGDIGGLTDLRGKTVRTYNRGMTDFVEAAGAATVAIPYAEVVPALQRGVADCAVTATSAGNTARWWEVTDSLVVVPMGWATTFFAANLNNWNRLDPRVQDFLAVKFQEMEDRQWAQAAADVEDGIRCNIAQGECKDGVPASPPMKLVELNEADLQLAREIVASGVLKGWADRCGNDCVKDWNEKVGSIVGVQAPLQ